MNHLSRTWLAPVLLLLALFSTATLADDEEQWVPTPPRLSFIDGEVSYWREGADDWARAQLNLALAEGDALYAAGNANFEVQFGRRSFVRADENSELALLNQDERTLQFKVTGGRVSFDVHSLTEGNRVEVSTPNAVFTIEHPGYYRVEVNTRETHFITRGGGEATVTTADGRSLSIYPSEDIVVTAGNPVKVATYAAPPPDDWDRWNDARSDRIGESVSARYLPPDVYGAEELDYYGRWRVVPSYGAVWIPYGVGVDWVPYSTGSWVWDPYYEWTWIDDAPWGWAPFHYGRWVYIDGFWAWAPGPVVRRPVYSPALVAFMIRDGDVSVRLSFGLPGVWWVALGWGEPVVPWWRHHRHRGHPRWDGWGGPRIVNNVVINQTTVINAGDIRYRNAALPRAILTVPPDKFGRERIRATVENRYRHTDFAPVRGELPVKPSRASLFGGAPKGVQPPKDLVARPVVSTRPPRERERAMPWQDEAARVRAQAGPEPRYVIPPAPRADAARPLPPRPPFGAETGSERTPPPLPPRYGEVKKAAPPPSPAPARSPTPTREQATERRELRPTPAMVTPPASVTRPTQQQAPRARSEAAPPASVSLPAPPSAQAPAARARPEAASQHAAPSVQAPARAEAVPSRGVVRQEGRERPLPGQPASQVYRGHDQDSRGKR